MPGEWLWFSLCAPTTKANIDKPAGVNAYDFTLIAMSFMEELPQRWNDALKPLKVLACGCSNVISEKEGGRERELLLN